MTVSEFEIPLKSANTATTITVRVDILMTDVRTVTQRPHRAAQTLQKHLGITIETDRNQIYLLFLESSLMSTSACLMR